MPETFRSESLAAELLQRAPGEESCSRVPTGGESCSRTSSPHLADVDQVAVYHNADATTIPEAVVDRLKAGTVDWITLTSPAITARLHDLLPHEARGRLGNEIRLASLSPVTTEAARSLGWSVAVEATEYTWDGLVRALVEHVVAERER